MMLGFLLAFVLLVPLQAAPAVEPEEPAPRPWVGPGRFCGYASVIDLQPGEQIIAGEGGVHGASYIWSGPFGAIVVDEINWASRPKHVVRSISKEGGIEIFQLRGGGSKPLYVVSDGGHLVAYLSSSMFRKNKSDLKYIRRIGLSDHAGDKGTGCKYRMLFSWE
ncbi:hypothetical protein NDN01_02590 [Sphingomonas sp. QA11]|uniref:hypothetical protein n=1 Tax=Sphingomonas sp. QA11 TaxID=2950605 RepID=UPI00234BC583|nr:hypothetical protein [Sphingomonas sp. QA11]WCM27836.1 hypothetical protein NDN01_02590 [Sphingomonas sp. QA11]